MFGVVTAGLDMMMFGVAGIAVGVVRGLFVIAGFMMLGGVLVMLGRLVMMLYAFVLAHVALPVRWLRVRPTYAIRLTLLLTAARQVCKQDERRQ